MARIAGVDLPREKKIEVALTHIYGIGKPSSQKIIEASRVDPDRRVKDLNEKEIESLRRIIESDYKVEGTLRAEVSADIKRLIEVGSHRGLRHRRGLPVRGQRTRTNARTRKGPRRGAIALKRKVTGKKG